MQGRRVHEALLAADARLGPASAACVFRRADPAGQLVERAAGTLSPEEALQQRQLLRMLLEAIDQLPPTYREVVLLRDVDERPVAEVARELHISRSNAAVRLHDLGSLGRAVARPAATLLDSSTRRPARP